MIRTTAATAFAALFLACSTSSQAPTKCAAAGQSVCLPPGTGGAPFCADLAGDAKNCGACNLACPAVAGATSVACHAGACATDCGGGFSGSTRTVCGSKTSTDGGVALACTDTATDHENCGSCGTVCNGAQQCLSGKCTVVAGTAACGGSGTGTTYADLRTDRANCGACGTACAANETCSDGACNPCPVAQCNNVCVDTQHDPNNCGACGNVVANCENGVGLAKITIDRTGVPFSPAVVGAGGSSYPISITVHSQIRVVRVTATIGATVTELTLVGPAEQDPTIWTGTIAIPMTATVPLIVDAFDELYQPRAADAGVILNAHSDEQTVTATVLAAPAAAATPTAPVVQAQLTPAIPVGPVFKWVPVNGPLLQFSTSVQPNQNIATVQFLENNNLFGTATVNASGAAVFSALPAAVGLGDLSITACPYDSAGQPGPCSPATTFTVGRIAPLGAPAVIGKNNDAGGGHTIYYVNASQQLFAQGFTDLDQGGATGDLPGKQVGGATYYADAVRAIPEGTGVYVVKADGSGVDRVESPSLVRPSYVTPAASAALRGIDLATPVALALCDNTAAPNSVSSFATAGGTQTTATAVAVGSLLSNGNGLRNGRPCPSIDTGSAFSFRPALQTTRSGAIVGWFQNGTDVRPQLFHPALPGNHVVPLIAAAQAGTVAQDLQVFPGGEIVFQFHDANNTTFLGAAYFDGTNTPVVLPPVQTGAAGNGSLGNFFLVAKPGVVLGQVPAPLAASGVQAVEIQLKGAGFLFPAPSNGTTAGPLTGGVQPRLGRSANFTISDDQTQALFVTLDQVAGAPNPVRRIHLLNLDAGTETPLGFTSGNGAVHLPHFVRSAPVYSGGAPAGAHQAVIWTETLPQAQGQTTSHERISIASFSGAVATVDRLNSFSAANSMVESAAGGVVLFLSQTDGGGADLYSAPIASAAGPVTATRVMDHVFWFKTREDKQRLLVARSDGTLYVAPLTPGANLARTLVPLVNAGFLGDAPILNGDGIGSFGFTYDGDHAYVLRDVHTSVIGPFGAEMATGIAETIDFTTGAFARTDFGRVVAGNVGGGAQPILGFVGGATTAVVLDQVSVEANAVRLAIAPPGAPTSRQDTLALAPGYQFFSDAASFSSSLDNNEGFLTYQPGGLFGGARIGGGSPSVRLQTDGTFDVLRAASFSGLQQPATFSPLAGRTLPDWSIVNDFTGASRSLFKVWGGASPARFIPVSRNFTAQTNSTATVITPDLKELLFSFLGNGDATSGYTMALPLPGHTPPTPLLP